MGVQSARIGAVLYALWGVVHVLGDGVLLVAAAGGSEAFLRAQAGGSVPGLGGLSGSDAALAAAQGVFAFHAFNLTWFGLLVTVIAVRLNWRNAAAGHWLNLALVGLVDLGLVLFIVWPGVLPLSDAWIGPALFAPAAIFSAVGRWHARPARPSGSAPRVSRKTSIEPQTRCSTHALGDTRV